MRVGVGRGGDGVEAGRVRARRVAGVAAVGVALALALVVCVDLGREGGEVAVAVLALLVVRALVAGAAVVAGVVGGVAVVLGRAGGVGVARLARHELGEAERLARVRLERLVLGRVAAVVGPVIGAVIGAVVGAPRSGVADGEAREGEVLLTGAVAGQGAEEAPVLGVQLVVDRRRRVRVLGVVRRAHARDRAGGGGPPRGCGDVVAVHAGPNE